MNPRRIGFLGYDHVQALDLAGPIDAFAAAMVEDGKGRQQRAYECVIIGPAEQARSGESARTFTAESGITFSAHTTLAEAPELDTLIVPGGRGLRVGDVSAKAAAWIQSRAAGIRRIASVCTGVYALAPTGLLDGRRVTTHWRFARDLAQRFPKLKVDPKALFLRDGRFYTSAGITAGIDLSLALIEEDLGPRAALSVARELVVYLKRPGGQEQFSEPLQFQTQSADHFADLTAWMLGSLHEDLSVEVLAQRACLCPRHFSRRFKSVFGNTPAAFVETLRLDEARRRLTAQNQNIESVAASVGFKSADAFRRAFERRFGIAPSSYRNQWVGQTASP